ncbi:MAG: hypothetical protein GY835_23435 [bacterium]|nr:hypothetical protein [bacterium]
MARDPRYIPEGGCVVNITNRTIQGRYLMRPDAESEINEIVLGVVGRAQRLYDVTLFALTFLSGHYHILAFMEDAEQQALFMNHVDGNLGKEVSRHADWPDKVWSRRFTSIPVSDEPEAQIARLR